MLNSGRRVSNSLITITAGLILSALKYARGMETQKVNANFMTRPTGSIFQARKSLSLILINEALIGLLVPHAAEPRAGEIKNST